MDINVKSCIKILETDRFSCIVINIVNSKLYKSVTVEEPFSKSYVYFGKVSLKMNINIGEILYLGVKKLRDIEDDKSMKVTLYNKDQSIDWTLIY